MVQHPGPDRELAVLAKEKKIKKRRCPRRGLGMATTWSVWSGSSS